MGSNTTIADIQFALSSMTRVMILLRLSNGKVRASALAAILDFSGPHLSNHLRVLRQAKLVRYTRERNCRLYTLTESVAASSTSSGMRLEVRADDGSVLSAVLPAATLELKAPHQLEDAFPDAGL